MQRIFVFNSTEYEIPPFKYTLDIFFIWHPCCATVFMLNSTEHEINPDQKHIRHTFFQTSRLYNFFSGSIQLNMKSFLFKCTLVVIYIRSLGYAIYFMLNSTEQETHPVQMHIRYKNHQTLNKESNIFTTYQTFKLIVRRDCAFVRHFNILIDFVTLHITNLECAI